MATSSTPPVVRAAGFCFRAVGMWVSRLGLRGLRGAAVRGRHRGPTVRRCHGCVDLDGDHLRLAVLCRARNRLAERRAELLRALLLRDLVAVGAEGGGELG